MVLGSSTLRRARIALAVGVLGCFGMARTYFDGTILWRVMTGSSSSDDDIRAAVRMAGRAMIWIIVASVLFLLLTGSIFIKEKRSGNKATLVARDGK